MKPVRLILLAWWAMFSLCGCLQVEKVVKVNADGSGTVEETVLMTKSSMENFKKMVAEMGPGFGGQKNPDKPFELFDEAKIKETGEKMGEGVTMVSATRISSEKGEGYKAIYAFTDINKLKIDQNPGSAMPSGDVVKPGAGSKKNEPIIFRFTKGGPAELAITMPPPEFTPRKEQPAGADDMAMQMMRQMFKDMKITMAVEVAGAIQETNAEYRDGARVTLMEMDMNKLLADPEKIKTMAQANPQSLQEAKALMKGIDGVKVESAPEVKIKFQ